MIPGEKTVVLVTKAIPQTLTSLSALIIDLASNIRSDVYIISIQVLNLPSEFSQCEQRPKISPPQSLRDPLCCGLRMTGSTACNNQETSLHCIYFSVKMN